MTSKKPFRCLPLLGVTLLASIVGCGKDTGGEAANRGGDGSSGDASSRDMAAGGEPPSGVDTSTPGTATGGARNGGAGNGGAGNGGAGNGGAAGGARNGGASGMGGASGVTGARSCQDDCKALAKTLCADADFDLAACPPKCEQDFRDAAASAKSKGCLEQFLILDACRADDPVCTHPNPTECVHENANYIQCLKDAL